MSKQRASSKVKILYLLNKCSVIGYDKGVIYDFITGNKKKKPNVKARIEGLANDFVFSECKNIAHYADNYNVSIQMVSADCKYIIRKLAWLIARYRQYGEKYEFKGGNANSSEIEDVIREMQKDLDIKIKTKYSEYEYLIKNEEKGTKWLKFFEESR